MTNMFIGGCCTRPTVLLPARLFRARVVLQATLGLRYGTVVVKCSCLYSLYPWIVSLCVRTSFRVIRFSFPHSSSGVVVATLPLLTAAFIRLRVRRLMILQRLHHRSFQLWINKDLNSLPLTMIRETPAEIQAVARLVIWRYIDLSPHFSESFDDRLHLCGFNSSRRALYRNLQATSSFGSSIRFLGFLLTTVHWLTENATQFGYLQLYGIVKNKIIVYPTRKYSSACLFRRTTKRIRSWMI